MDTKSKAESKSTQIGKHGPKLKAAQTDALLIEDMGTASEKTQGLFGFYWEFANPPYNEIPS